MPPRKPKVDPKNALPEDCIPKCSTCNASEFKDPKNDEEIGECHLLPMDWVVVVERDDQPVPMWKPCVKTGWCRHYQRKTN